ncbi:cis-Golgi t-SNARE syntaxin [Tulasnella sp. 330]|nr:cis-Golgi t-SNARE syntaxin [Tulasnella sp. 330]
MAVSSDISAFGLRRPTTARHSRRHATLLSRRPISSCAQSIATTQRSVSLLARDIKKPACLQPIDLTAIESAAPQFKGLDVATITNMWASSETQSRMIEGLSKSSVTLCTGSVKLELRDATASAIPPTHLLSLRNGDGSIASLLPCHSLPLLLTCASLPPAMASSSSGTLSVIDLNLPSPSTLHIIRDYAYTRCRRSLLAALLPMNTGRVPPTPEAMAASLAALSVLELSARSKAVYGVYLNACRIGMVDEEFWKSLPPSPHIIMPALDRTTEFRACVESISKRSASIPTPNTEQKQRLLPNGVAKGKSEFASMASGIGKDITNTTVKLGKLAQLAKRKTLFDDRPVEISELTFIIKQDIAHINKSIAALQAYTKSRNVSASGSKQVEEHNNNVVMLLQSKLASTSMTFKDVLEVRTQVSKTNAPHLASPHRLIFDIAFTAQNMKESKDRTEQFVSTASAATQAPASNSLLYPGRRQQADGDSSASPFRPSSRASSNSKGKGRAVDSDLLALDMTSVEEGMGGGVNGHANGGGLMQMQLVEQQDTYIQSRSTAIESIESTIAELGQIFTQLAQMVAEQRETVQRIDADTIDIANNVSGAQRELLKYYAGIASNRWLMLKVFGVLIVFFLVFILVS